MFKKRKAQIPTKSIRSKDFSQVANETCIIPARTKTDFKEVALFYLAMAYKSGTTVAIDRMYLSEDNNKVTIIWENGYKSTVDCTGCTAADMIYNIMENIHERV